MTTPLTITTAVLAVCAVALLLHSSELRKKLKSLREAIDFRDNAASSESVKYVIEKSQDKSVTVWRVYCDGVPGLMPIRRHKTLIKRFTDPDAEFNLREAEELIEKLNEE